MTEVVKSDVVVNPETGEQIDLPNAKHEDLVEAFLILQDHERRAKEWRVAVEDELTRRHGSRRGAQVVGDFEIDLTRSNSREWDGYALEGVLVELVGTGELTLADVHGIVKTERKVDGNKAVSLLNQLDGEPLQRIRDCFTWKKGRAKVKVTPVVALEAPDQ